jgi:hypothetical protein
MKDAQRFNDMRRFKGELAVSWQAQIAGFSTAQRVLSLVPKSIFR